MRWVPMVLLLTACPPGPKPPSHVAPCQEMADHAATVGCVLASPKSGTWVEACANAAANGLAGSYRYGCVLMASDRAAVEACGHECR